MTPFLKSDVAPNPRNIFYIDIWSWPFLQTKGLNRPFSFLLCLLWTMEAEIQITRVCGDSYHLQVLQRENKECVCNTVCIGWFAVLYCMVLCFTPSDFGHPAGIWKCVSVLPALLSSTYQRPSASAGAELLEVAPTLLVFRSATRGEMLMECLLPPCLLPLYLHAVCVGCSLSYWSQLTVQGSSLVLACSWVCHLTNNQD